MFVLKKAQLDAFRQPVRREKREKIVFDLKLTEGNKVFEENDKIILEDKKGRISELSYSEKNLLHEYQKPSGLRYHFDYDEEDRISQVTFPGNEFFKLGYKNEYPANIIINEAVFDFKYDSKNRIAEVIYPDKNAVRFTYNENNQLASITNRANEMQSYETTIENNRIVHHLKDALGRETVLKMDTFGGLEEIIFPDGSTQETAYDDEENAEIVKLRNGSNRTTFFNSYQPYRVEWSDGNFQQVSVNDLQKVKTIENEAGTIHYEYDEKKRPVSESFQGSTVNYIYEDDYLKSIKYPGGLAVVYEYDEDDRIKSIAIDNNTCTYKYAPNGTIAEIDYPNRLIRYQTSKLLGGLQETKLLRSSGQILSRQTYRYDAITRLTRLNDYKENSLQKSREFRYDDECRLTSVVEDLSGLSEKFEYDGKGNMIKANETVRVVGKIDQLLSIGSSEIEYDQNGNVTNFRDDKYRKLQLKFSDNGTMLSAQVNNEKWEYFYDGLGRRVGKSNGKEAVTFFWSGDKLIQEEHRAGNKSIIREYIYADGATPIAFREESKLYWLMADIRGAITHVYDEQGNSVWVSEYSAFGKATVTTEIIRQPWRLAGQYYDEESGLHYNKARYYSPHLCTFLSLDPKWYLYGATNYSYAANDPYNKIDVDGNMPGWLSKTLSIGAGIIVGVAVGAAAIALAPVLGVSLLGLAVVGAIAGGLGAVAESVVSDLTESKPICWPCALKSGLIGAALGAVLGPLLKVLGNALAPVARKILPKITQRFPKSTNALRSFFNRFKPNKKFNPQTASNSEKGVFGEAKTDELFISKGYKKLNGEPVNVGDSPRGNGIDHIYHNPTKNPPYTIVESKYASSSLKTLDDGTRQMSDKWILARLESEEITKEQAKDMIKKGFNSVVSKVDANGNIVTKIVNKDGYIVRGSNGIFNP